MPDIPITSLDDPRLALYRDVKTKRAEAREGRFIAEGHRVVERLLSSRYSVESILATDRRRHLLDCVDLRGAPVLLLPEDLASELIGYQFHGGIMACGTRRPGPAIGDLFPAATADSAELVVVCPRITDPDNLGGLMRLCRAFGAAALVVGPPSVDPFSRRVLRVSMGNAFHLPIVQPPISPRRCRTSRRPASNWRRRSSIRPPFRSRRCPARGGWRCSSGTKRTGSNRGGPTVAATRS